MGTDRREFIKKSLYGVLAFLGLSSAAVSIRLFSPTPGHDKSLVFFPLMPEDDIPRSGVKKAELVFPVSGRERKTRVFLVSSSGGIAVFSAVCSHLGCLVNYQKEKKEFVCPCHGGRYDLSGRNISGPPPAPLTQYPVRTEGGMLMVGVKV